MGAMMLAAMLLVFPSWGKAAAMGPQPFVMGELRFSEGWLKASLQVCEAPDHMATDPGEALPLIYDMLVEGPSVTSGFEEMNYVGAYCFMNLYDESKPLPLFKFRGTPTPMELLPWVPTIPMGLYSGEGTGFCPIWYWTSGAPRR